MSSCVWKIVLQTFGENLKYPVSQSIFIIFYLMLYEHLMSNLVLY